MPRPERRPPEHATSLAQTGRFLRALGVLQIHDPVRDLVAGGGLDGRDERTDPSWTTSASRLYTPLSWYLLRVVAKHLVDVDEDALDDAKRELGTSTIKDTINLALRRSGARRRDDIKRQLDLLARADFAPRDQAWR